MILVWSPRFHEHTPPPGHPERPERAVVFASVASAFLERGGTVQAPAAVSRDELLRVHAAEYVDDLERTSGRAARLDVDTFTSPESYEVALLAAGAACQAARHAWQTREPALALVRPPGHHAETATAMGFCLFNNVAVATAALRAEGVARVAIVDIDVHHGNGTQATFYEDPTVLYASTHQYPYYPGTGAAGETGAGPGAGATVNVPLEAGTADAAFLAAYDETILPALDAFRPEILLVSAGYDAHQLDPLGGLRVTTAGYEAVVRRLGQAAGRLCDGRIALVTEGGYHLGALRECLDATIAVLT